MLLKVEYAEKYYGNKKHLTKALDQVSFQVEKGEFISIMGASGSGKTTLLNCISTIDTVSGGHIYLEGQDMTTLGDSQMADFRLENLGFIFQDFNLLDQLTVEENIAMPLVLKGATAEAIKEKVSRICKLLDIEKILPKFPYEISGGQKQRCACARAVIGDPKLILADEPTGALDSKAARQLLEMLIRLNKELDATILMVTHDPLSASYAERILFLKDGQLFNELVKGEKSRRQFYDQILNVLALLGGDADA